MKVTVVIPARNAARFLPDTLASIHRQTVRPSRVIVVDDGSTDSTSAIGKQQGADVIRSNGVGAAGALNLGIDAARTSLIAHFDADDLMEPHKLERQLARFIDCSDIGRPRLGMVSSDLRMFDADGPSAESFLERREACLEVPLEEIASAFTAPWLCFDPHASAQLLSHQHAIDVKGVYLRDAWQLVGGFDPSFRCAYDMDFVWRLSRQFRVDLCRETLFLGRKHTENLSGNPRLVARECARHFANMSQHPHAMAFTELLRKRRRNEIRDVAYSHREQRHWLRSAAWYVRSLLA